MKIERTFKTLENIMIQLDNSEFRQALMQYIKEKNVGIPLEMDGNFKCTRIEADGVVACIEFSRVMNVLVDLNTLPKSEE